MQITAVNKKSSPNEKILGGELRYKELLLCKFLQFKYHGQTEAYIHLFAILLSGLPIGH